MIASVWLLLVVAVVAAIANQEHFFAVDNKRIAVIGQKTGPVQVRAEGLVRWGETVKGQGLVDGDRVATGRGGAARVDFGPGRAILLAEETQVQITAIVTSSREAAFMITLLRGTAVASIEKRCGGCPPLVIRAGDDTFNVSAGTRVGVIKAVGRKARKFQPQGVWPSAKAKPTPVIATVTSPPSDALVGGIPAPVPTSTPIPATVVLEVEPPTLGANLFTVQPLSSLGAIALEFPLVPGRTMPEEPWRPVLLVFGAGARRSAIQGGRAADKAIRVALAKIRGVAGTRAVGGAKDYTFSVRAGVLIDGAKTASFGPRRVDVRIRTYGELDGAPVTLGMDRVGTNGETGPWTSPKSDIAARSAPVVIQLAFGQDFARLLPFVRAARQVGLAPGGPDAGSGVYVVRGRTVVAQLRGAGLGADAIRQVLVRLNADFVFEGARSALSDLSGDSWATDVARIDALLDQGRVLYILKRNKLYPVSRDFIKTNAEVAQFVDNQAKAIFLEQVTILDYR